MSDLGEFVSIVTKNKFEQQYSEDGIIVYKKEFGPGLSARLTVSQKGWTLGPTFDLTKMLTGDLEGWPDELGQSVGDYSHGAEEFNLEEFVRAYEKVIGFIRLVAHHYAA